MAKLDDVLADVSAESTLIDGIGTLISGLKQQIADALAGSSISAADQAKIDQIFAQAESNKAKLADALAANTLATAAPPSSMPPGGMPPEPPLNQPAPRPAPADVTPPPNP